MKQKEGCYFKAQSIQRMELLILGALKWRMRSITPFSFLHFFISLAEIKDQSLKQTLKNRASEIIFNAQNGKCLFLFIHVTWFYLQFQPAQTLNCIAIMAAGIKFLEYKPSTIAATSLIFASHELFPQQYSTLRASITACEYLDEVSLHFTFNHYPLKQTFWLFVAIYSV